VFQRSIDFFVRVPSHAYHQQRGRTLEVQIDDMGSYAELILGPKGEAEHGFFWE